MRRSRTVLGSITVAAGVALAVSSWPASGEEEPGNRLDQHQLAHLSGPVALRAAAADPDAAPAGLRPAAERVRRLRSLAAARRLRGGGGGRGGAAGQRPFNADDLGLPQNEEAVNACRDDTRIVLGGTNDYRGLVDPEGNLTGWHLSTDGGRHLANEGLLPPVAVGADQRPSGGDPVVAVDDRSCDLYMVDLNYDPDDPEGNTNAVGVYKSDAATLRRCPGGPDPSCWPQRRAADQGAPPHFLDKPWADVGQSGPAGRVVWISYSDFLTTGPGETDFTASIKAVRCDAQLASCTPPIDISGDDQDVQFSDVTIGPDGRTYLTWSEIRGEIEGTPQTFIHKIRVAEPGSLAFGPERVVATEPLPIPFGGFLHANDFRVATQPKSEIATSQGRPRVFVTWDACSERPLDTICVEPVIKLTYSDDFGQSWSRPRVVSAGGDNYFPTLSPDRSGSVALAWFTNRFDPQFHNRQDVELIDVDVDAVRVTSRERITSPSNESEADPLLGGNFIGDYIEVFAHHGRAWTHYNANYRSAPLLGEGTPLPQQDNYLDVRGL
jgi:hypothetical protein